MFSQNKNTKTILSTTTTRNLFCISLHAIQIVMQNISIRERRKRPEFWHRYSLRARSTSCHLQLEVYRRYRQVKGWFEMTLIRINVRICWTRSLWGNWSVHLLIGNNGSFRSMYDRGGKAQGIYYIHGRE